MFTYRTIFDFHIFHDYFLNKGQSSYNDVPDDEKSKRLQQYDFNSFLTLKPTSQTKKLIINHRLITKQSMSNYSIIGKVDEGQNSLIEISPTEFFQFYLILNDAEFLNYTSLSLDNQNYLILSNHPILEYLPELATLDGNPISDLHLVSKEILINNLREEETLPNKCIGIISIASKSIYDQLSLLEDDGKLRPSQNFTIRFQNRATFWKYILKSGTELTTVQALPLTKNGFIPITEEHLADFDDYEVEFPNPNNSKITLEGNQAYSEIFINI